MSIPTSPTHIGSTHWFPELNFGRGINVTFPTDEAKVAGEDNVLVDGFARAGKWLPTFPVETCAITKELADKAVAQRKEWLAAAELLAKASEIGKIILAILTVRYTNKSGIIRPTMLGVTGNRRAAAIDLGFLRRLAYRPSDKNAENPADMWPGPDSRHKSESHEAWVRRLCNFDYYFVYRADIKTDDDMMEVQIEENELRTEGAKKVDLHVNLGHVRYMLQKGRTQADIQRRYGALGQKMTQVVLFDLQNPAIDLINRMKLKGNDPRRVSFGKLPNSMAKLIAATSPDKSKIDEFNSRKGREEKDKIKTSLVGKPDLIEAEIQSLITPSSGTRDPMMDRDTIEKQIAVHSQNPLIVDVLLSVKGNDTGLLAKASDATAAVRALYALMDDKESYQQVENLLMKLAESEVGARVKLLKKSA